MYAIDYEEALKDQKGFTRLGRVGWLLFYCPPTITLGLRAKEEDLKLSRAELEKKGIKILKVNRGGEVTYHGPGQIVGFPVGTLEQHIGDSRGVKKFVSGLTEDLQKFITHEFKLSHQKDRKIEKKAKADCPGVWVREKDKTLRKIVSIGMSFHRTGIGHGFALNVQPQENPFSLITACGDPTTQVTSLFIERQPNNLVSEVCERLQNKLGVIR